MLKKDYTPYSFNSSSNSHTLSSNSNINNQGTLCNVTDEFYKACVCGDFESAMAFIKMGVNLNVRFHNGQNLLHIACAKNFYGLAQLLIKFGCNEFLKDNDGRTSLHYAILSNSISIVRYLIEKNIFNKSNLSNITSDMLIREFLNVQDNRGKTALHLACENKYYEIVNLILNTNMVDVNLRDFENKTALMSANNANCLDICELLIKYGSTIDESILIDMCSKGNLSELQIFLKYDYAKLIKSYLRYRLANSNSFLYLAIKFSFDLNFINELLELGVRPVFNDMFDLLEEAQNNLIRINDSKNSTSYYLECMILLLKFNCFNQMKHGNINDYSKLTKYIKCLKLNDNFIIEYDAENASKLLIMILLQIICDMHNSNKDSTSSNSRKRLIYSFALAIYSSQLNFRKIYFKQWLKQLTNNQCKNNNLNELNDILNDSLKNPWSLQMLCRNVIRKNLDNVNDLTNDDHTIRKYKLSPTSVRFLKFEYI